MADGSLTKIHRHTGGLESEQTMANLGYRIHRHTGGLEKVHLDSLLCSLIHRHTGGLENLSQSANAFS